MVGADFVLDPPTPMQWQSLEETVVVHQKHLKDELQSLAVASIDAAPLVAIMDEYTSSAGQVLQLQGTKKAGRYATIAAVVGISSNAVTTTAPIVDTSDETSFMESIMRIGRSATPLDSKIRLVGIGRAVLYDFYYQVPTRQQDEAMDEHGHLILENDGDIDDDACETNLATNIVMADFRLLTDSAERSYVFELPGRSAFASPVHAMAKMSNMANKLQRIHQDRRRYVAGLQAAKSRLKGATQGSVEEEDLLDHDGLGMLFAQYGDTKEEAVNTDRVQPVIDEFLNTFHDDAQVEHTRLLALENYGMGYSSASISSIHDLTHVWLEKLQPYYSPARRESEEHHFEVLSFVACLSMAKFLEPHQLGKALRCTNTIERLGQVYEWMWEHVRLLKQESEKISQELRNCGEECTDLW